MATAAATAAYDEAGARKAWIKLKQAAWKEFLENNEVQPRNVVRVTWETLSPAAKQAFHTVWTNWIQWRDASSNTASPEGIPDFTDQAECDQYRAIQTRKLASERLAVDALQALIDWRTSELDPYDTVGYLDRLRTRWEDIINLRDADIDYIAKQRNAVKAEEEKRYRRALMGDDYAEKGWIAGPNLTQGGYATPQLWLKKDMHGKIIDRLVTKDSEMAHLHIGQNIPNEVRVLYELRPLKGAGNVVSVRNWRQVRDQYRYLLLMEYCPHGDLYSLLERYGQFNADRPVGMPFMQIPEAFIWSVFESLAQVGVLLERGELDAKSTREWELIIHRDIKPLNVFMSDAEYDRFRGYPAIKLGDFGLAMSFDEAGKCTTNPSGGDTNRRSALVERWTALASQDYVHSPPEERNCDLDNADPPPEFSSKCDVWSVGMIIWSLMRQLDYDQEFEQADAFARSAQPADLDEDEERHYSGPLKQLCFGCTSYLPEDRPDFDTVLRRIRRRRSDRRKAVADELRHAPANDPMYLKHSLYLDNERYKKGFMLAKEAFNNDEQPEPEAVSDALPSLAGPNPDKNSDESSSSDDDDPDTGTVGRKVTLPPKPVQPPPDNSRDGNDPLEEQLVLAPREPSREGAATPLALASEVPQDNIHKLSHIQPAPVSTSGSTGVIVEPSKHPSRSLRSKRKRSKRERSKRKDSTAEQKPPDVEPSIQQPRLRHPLAQMMLPPGGSVASSSAKRKRVEGSGPRPATKHRRTASQINEEDMRASREII